MSDFTPGQRVVPHAAAFTVTVVDFPEPGRVRVSFGGDLGTHVYPDHELRDLASALRHHWCALDTLAREVGHLPLRDGLFQTVRHLEDAALLAEAADAVRGISPAAVVTDDYDPTDAELGPDYAAQGWSERNANVLRLVAQIESGEA